MTKKFKIVSNIILICVISLFLFVSKISIKATENRENTFADQTIVFMGDSITENFEEEGSSYPDLIANDLGVNAINLGFGGASMSTHPNQDFNAFSFISLSNSIASEDYSSQRAALSGEEIPDYFSTKVDVLEQINWNDVDIITVMLGANDWGKAIENENDLYDINTFLGAGRTGVEQILEKYPHIQFLFIPTIYRFWPENNLDTQTAVNSFGHKPSDFSEAMTQLAKEYHFPAVDTLYGLGFNVFNRSIYFNDNDGTHPNQIGTNKLAELISNYLELYY